VLGTAFGLILSKTIVGMVLTCLKVLAFRSFQILHATTIRKENTHANQTERKFFHP
jgi:hypothetical protein